MEYSFQFAEWENRGKILRGSMYLTRNKDAPWVILCHGFTSHRIGPNYFYVSIARHLASQGICSIAFDFSGCGESDGLFSDVTISSMCSDLVSAYHYVKDNYKPTNIFLLGHSFGGTIAVLTAHNISVPGLILISPVADTVKQAQLNENVLKNGKNEDGYYEFGPNEMSITFWNELKECNPVSIFSQNFKGSLILLQGENDDQITVEESSAYIDVAKKSDINTTYHIITNADHRFSDVKSRKFINQTIAKWIKETVL